MLWYAERGHVDVLAGAWPQALRRLDEAAFWMNHWRTRSLAGDVIRWFANDTVSPYYGRGFETLQIGYWRWLTNILLAQVADESRPPLSHLVTRDGRTSRPTPTANDLDKAAWEYRDRAMNLALVMTQTDLIEVSDFPDGR